MKRNINKNVIRGTISFSSKYLKGKDAQTINKKAIRKRWGFWEEGIVLVQQGPKKFELQLRPLWLTRWGHCFPCQHFEALPPSRPRQREPLHLPTLVHPSVPPTPGPHHFASAPCHSHPRCCFTSLTRLFRAVPGRSAFPPRLAPAPCPAPFDF